MSNPNIKILIDTREQLPLEFKHKFVSSVSTGKLNVGDYAAEFINGYRPPVVFERKSLGDLYGTLSAGYERFKCEIERAKEAGTQIIIIVEGSLTRVGQGIGYSNRTPASIIYQIFTLLAKHGIWTIFCSNRDEASEYITQFYIAHEKYYFNDKPLKGSKDDLDKK